ncbi:MAG TPA: hypothetical protein VGR51_01505 [Thermoplasmata archaeon]|jgi:hypothetical protein|nr:hypothetical protein [Thermoplasmata archaeon]
MAGVLTPTAFLIIGVLLAIVGLLLALFGRKMWTPFMSIIGAVLGGSAGYFIGVYYAPGSTIVPLMLALLGSVLGSILFNYLVKIALALIASAIPAYLVYRAMNPNPVTDQSAQSPAVIAAILALLAVFAVSYFFVEELIGVVTSLVGAFLLGIGVFLATGDGTYALIGGGLVFLMGAILQTLAIRRAKKGGSLRMRRARAAAMAPGVMAAPRAPPPPSAAPPAPGSAADPPPPPRPPPS